MDTPRVVSHVGIVSKPHAVCKVFLQENSVLEGGSSLAGVLQGGAVPLSSLWTDLPPGAEQGKTLFRLGPDFRILQEAQDTLFFLRNYVFLPLFPTPGKRLPTPLCPSEISESSSHQCQGHPIGHRAK